jgi:hypothetical protein
MIRYAAKLLFIWDPDPITNRRDRRYCEERIVLFMSRRSAAFAVKKAKAIGKVEEVSYDSGHRLRFAGVLECMRMEALYHSDGEVWYEMQRRTNPDTWAQKAIPPEFALDVFKEERLMAQQARARKPKASRNRR